MRRRVMHDDAGAPISSVTDEDLELRSFLGKKLDPKKRTGPLMSESILAKHIAEVNTMRETGEWDGAGGRTMVALYYVLHEWAYGIKPDLTSKERGTAVFAAARMLAREFDGDAPEMARFMLDVWTRERSTEKWRRENGGGGGSISAYRLFNQLNLLGKWRLDRVRKGKV